jgi:hypothetical protein
MWKKALRVEYDPLVDVRRVREKRKLKLTKVKSVVYEVARYVAKYAVKHTELVNRSDEDFKEILEQTYRMRTFSVGGILKKVMSIQRIERSKINFSDARLEDEWEEIEELLYRWKEEKDDYELEGRYRTNEVEIVSMHIVDLDSGDKDLDSEACSDTLSEKVVRDIKIILKTQRLIL